jgi:hypothetical protein
MVGKSLTPPVSPYYEAIPPAPPEWWDPNWTRRRAITISGYHPTDYQLKVVLPFYDPSIRFLENATSGLLPYWVESYTANSMTVWVKRSIANDGDDHTIYVYYNNPNAGSASDGNATFMFFDDFLGTSLDTSKWNGLVGSGGSISVANSQLRLDKAEVVTKTWQITDGVVEHRGYSAAKEISMIGRANTNTSFGVFAAAETQGGHGFYTDSSIPSWSHAIVVANAIKASVVSPITTNKWYKYRFILSGVILQFIRFDDNWTQEASVNYTDTGGLTQGYIGLHVDGTGSGDRVAYYDWVRVRKYVDPEPTVSVGEEEQYGG